MIELVDLNWQHTLLKEQLETAFQEVLNSNRFILGPQIQQLEESFAQYHHCHYGIGVSSGTDALVVTLKALDIKAGDEVIVPSMTFYATAEAVCIVGATPVIVDVEPETLALDPSLTEAAITKRTKAIIPVHLHGWPIPLDPFLAIAEKHDLAIIEDCAQAHGARESGYPVGSRTLAGCFSFFPGKNLGALGDAGIVVTNNKTLADKIRSLANHGRKEKYFHDAIGYNARLDELQAAFLNVKIKYIEEWNEQRRTLAARYNQKLLNLPLKLPPQSDSQRLSCFHLYVVHCSTSKIRDHLAHFLKQQSIQTGVHYPVPIHLQPGLNFLGHQLGDFPIAEQGAEHILSLPIYPGMTTEKQNYVIQKVTEFFSMHV
jgi:dTDP-4-amino-4,6-dideoxygalactose transaminase